MHQASTSALLSLAVVAGCTSPAEATPTVTQARPAPPSAGNLPTTPSVDRTSAIIAELRAKGQAGLDEILAVYDRAAPRDRAALASTVDAVAAQRYATESRLYWYTDEDAARREAKRTGRPILALRMLGRLDEDLSCANSRFFRTALYPDERVAKLLREELVLLWTSERPVPRVTIDYGDGRVIAGTVTGNSIHYVLDADGAVVDALPGLYIPQVFVAELRGALAELAHERRAKLTGAALVERRRARWRDKLASIYDSFSAAQGALWVPNSRALLTSRDVQTALERAQAAAMSKARVEVPLLRRILPGTTPGDVEDTDVVRWASIGQAMFDIGEADLRAAPDDAFLDGGERRKRRVRGAIAAVRTALTRQAAAVERDAPPPVLGARPRRLIAQVFEGGQRAPGVPADAAAVLARFEQRMVADTALAQTRLRPRILEQLATRGAPTMAELNAWVYAEVFATPREDKWLGLLPRDEYTGLPGDGVMLLR